MIHGIDQEQNYLLRSIALIMRVVKLSSRILPTFPHVDNRCGINPSRMVFMIFDFAQRLMRIEVQSMRENAF